MNKVILSGYIGQDCEVKTFDGGGKAVTATLATSYQKKNHLGEYEDATDWHNIKVQNHKANFAEVVLKKGNFVVVWGKLKHREYEDKNGQKKYFTEVVVDELEAVKK
jgi:single-strand DNA-binding protein